MKSVEPIQLVSRNLTRMVRKDKKMVNNNTKKTLRFRKISIHSEVEYSTEVTFLDNFIIKKQ